MSKFGDAFKAARAAGDKTFTFNGKSYTTKTKEDVAKDVAAANASDDPIRALAISRGAAPVLSDDAEAGNGRGSRNYRGAGRGGQGGPSAADLAPDARDAEAGMSRGTRAGAGAGRGLQGTGVDGYKKGGSVKSFKGYGKAKKV